MTSRKASWYMMSDNEAWVVYFEGPEGVYLDTCYQSNDFNEVQAVVAAWVNEGKFPEE